MNKTSLILSAIFLAAITITLMPGILSRNRGRILRNTALWLAIFVGLALFYKNFGPESAHPLFSMPQGLVRSSSQSSNTADTPPPKETEPKKPNSEGYTPPQE